MKSQRHILTNTVLFVSMTLLTVLSSIVKAGEKQWVVFHDNIPQSAERINIKLKFTQSRSNFYDTSRRNIKAEEIEKARKKNDYKQQLDLGTLIDENQYVVMIRDAGDIDVISQGSDRLCMAKVLRIKDKKKPETVKEGLMIFRRNLKIPLEVSLEQLNVPSKEPLKGSLEINIYSNDYLVYEGICQVTVKGTLSGSTSTGKAFVDASITCNGSTKQEDWSLNLTLKPFDDKMAPASCKGKLSDMLLLSSAKLVVEKIASDSSELVLALLDGNMVQERQQDDTLATVGRPFPAFARVELVQRQLLTLDDLKKEAGADGYIVLIFGDFKITMPVRYGGRPPMRNLLLDEMMISDILKKDCEKPIVISFVCQQLSVSDLYEKWLDRDPEFRVLSDFSNPLNIQFFGVSMEPHMFHQQDKGENLRGMLKFENQKVITALIDGNGDLVYLNTDAGNELAGSLVQINNLMKKGKRAESQD